MDWFRVRDHRPVWTLIVAVRMVTVSQVQAPDIERISVKSVAMPREHGGWGLTIEPGLLGLLVAPSWAGLYLGLAALVAFVARTPVKLVLVDRWRGRFLPRTRLALVVAIVEVAVLVSLVMAAVVLASDSTWWLPMVAVAPLVGVELWYDMRSRGRRLVPELAGAVGITGIAAMVALAGGAEAALAVGLWAVLAGRALTSIPWVRVQIMRFLGRPFSATAAVIGDVGAAAAAGLAVALTVDLIVGAAALVGMIVLQRVVGAGAPRPAKKIGIMQMILGLALVLLTAAGTQLT